MNVGAIGLLDSFENANQHVVILRPDHINLRIFGQEVLHHAEGIVAVPVTILAVKHLDIGALDTLIETVLALLIDRDWQAANDDDLCIRGRGLDIFTGHLPQCGVVTSHVKIADGIVVVARRAVYQSDEGPLVLDLLDGVDQRIGISRRDNEAIQPLHCQILQSIGLRCGIGRRLDDDVEARMLLHQKLRHTLGVIDDACRPAMVGSRDRHADRHFLILCACCTGKSQRARRQCSESKLHQIPSHGLPPSKRGALIPLWLESPQQFRQSIDLSSGQRTLHQHSDNYDCALNCTEQIFADKARQQHDIADNFQNEGAADRTPDAPHAAT
ncbi:Hypothetical protein BCAN_A0556 [Brucella canis ATCC 23365]|uniref:Uncharacterized protein n=1 Tax=Brucella canis (strain ATCC 23365 / NCTC 10854 / RM-666) TaxID=483179 RepID=A9M9G9_BRUC2|nr:Hypothetical protein BCAN_A0556 [Brucella canis ATCC 23365]